MGRAVKALALSLAIALGLSACSNDYTLAYLYLVTSNTLPHGFINAYQVDYQSGVLNVMPDSPIDAGGRNTVAIVAAPNNLFLYTVNNFDSSVVEYAIGTDGKLYPQHTYNVTGSFPTAAAIDAQGKFLYVAFTYQNTASGQPLFTPANPGPGGVTVYPINSDNSLGTPTTVNVGRNPVAVATSRTGNFVYVIDQDSASQANLLGFTQNAVTVTGNTTSNSTSVTSISPTTGVTNGISVSGAGIPAGTTLVSGAGTANWTLSQAATATASGVSITASGTLTPMPGVTITAANVPSIGFVSGPSPAGILGDSSGTHLYVTDKVLNQVGVYAVAPNGVPTLASTIATDAAPMGMSFDLNGKFLYVAANTANVLNIFNVGSSGQLTRLNSGGTVQVGDGPTCVSVAGSPSNANPRHAVYLYTSNRLSNNVTGEQLNEQDGTLVQMINSPFGGSSLPACLVAVPSLPIRN
jgi:6-phosphogluconolactonase